MKSIQKTFSALVLTCAAFAVHADTQTVDGVTWTYTIKDGEASVGGGAPRATAVDVATAGDLTIPQTLGGCPVTAVGDYAFNYCSDITSVKIPDGVVNIGVQAFCECDALTTADIPAGVTNLSEKAFLNSGIRSAVVPEGIENLSDSLFYGCGNLISVTLPAGLKNIGWGAFVSCGALQSLDIPSTVTNFDNRAFSGCGFSGTFVIPRDLASFAASAFEMCKGISAFVVETGNVNYVAADGVLIDGRTATVLRCPRSQTAFDVPVGVRAIGDSAFDSCVDLQSVSLPTTLVAIADNAFNSCKSLKAITVPVGVTELGHYAFSSCSGLESIVLPEGLGSVGNNALANCSALRALTVPTSVTNVGMYAFCNCTSLRDVALPSLGGTVRDNILSGCSSMTNVTFASGVDYLGYNLFMNCRNLKTVCFEGDAPTTVRSGVYFATPTNLVTVVNRGTTGWNGVGRTDLPSAWPVGDSSARSIRYAGPAFYTVAFDLGDHGVRTGGGALVQEIEDGSAAVAPEVTASVGWKLVGWSRFFECVTEDMTVTAVYEELPKWVETDEVDGVTWTFVVSGNEASAGGGSVKLTAVQTSHAGVVTVPSSLGGYPLAALGKSAFENCKSMTSVVLPEGVRRIDGGAFRACSGLQSFTLPSTLQSVGMFAFYGCKALGEATFPAELATIGANAFRGCSSLERVRFSGDVPQGLATSGLIGSSTKIYYPQSYATGYEAIVPPDQRGVLFGALKTTFRSVVNGKDVDVPNTWATSDLDRSFGIGKSAKFAARYGRDLVLALFEKTGKVDGSGRQMTVMDDFVAGTDPTDESSRLQIGVLLGADGIPHVTWTPDLNENGQKAERVYRLMGARSPAGPWREIKDAETSGCQFFKVSVEMP